MIIFMFNYSNSLARFNRVFILKEDLFIEKGISIKVSEKFFKLLDERLKNKKIDGYLKIFNNCRKYELIICIHDSNNSLNIGLVSKEIAIRLW